MAGKLRVVRTLGVGGMGAVYEVEHTLTRHHRALKILHRRVSQSTTVVARFQREASAAARIGNPHISETFDAGTLDTGEAYLLMELLEGETLDGRLQRSGPLEPGDLADLIQQACDGVQAAHEAGIVHRDLKPENLFVTVKDGAPFLKVLDFGISKFEAESGSGLGVTAEGAVMGTPFYMPPEQVRGLASIDLRADVYSLGVILYECSTGVRPYTASTIEQLAVLIHEGKPVPLVERRPGLPRAFCEVVERAMAVDRDQRFQTARALAEALAPFRAARSGSSMLPGAARKSEPPRVVIRQTPSQFEPSGAPPAQGAPESPSSVMSADTALAATLGANAPPPMAATASPVSDTVPPPPDPPNPRRAGSWVLLGCGAVAAVAVVSRLLLSDVTPPVASSPVSVAPPASTPSAPLLPTTVADAAAAPGPVTSAAQPEAGTIRVAVPAVPAHTGGPKGPVTLSVADSAPIPALPVSVVAPPARHDPPAVAPVPKTHAEEKGLVTDKPYGP